MKKPEQKKIAAILSTWDKAIEKTVDSIQAKEKQKKGEGGKREEEEGKEGCTQGTLFTSF